MSKYSPIIYLARKFYYVCDTRNINSITNSKKKEMCLDIIKFTKSNLYSKNKILKMIIYTQLLEYSKYVKVKKLMIKKYPYLDLYYFEKNFFICQNNDNDKFIKALNN